MTTSLAHTSPPEPTAIPASAYTSSGWDAATPAPDSTTTS